MTAQSAQRRAVQADRRLVDDLLHDVGGSRPKATGRAVVLADEARKTATECEAAGDHPGAADLRASAERLDRAGAILAAPYCKPSRGGRC